MKNNQMMDYKMKKLSKLIATIGIIVGVTISQATFVNQAQASEVLAELALSTASANGTHIEEDSQDESGDLQGYLKVGYGYKNEKSGYDEEVSGLSLFVNGRYDWQGFFLESYYGANERSEGVSIGYNFYNTENWSFDVNTVLAHGETKSKIFDVDKIFVHERKSTTMLALRATGYFDQDITLQMQFAPYSFNDENDDGHFATAWLSKAWFIKNWEVHTSVGVKYYSADFLDYNYGISEEDASMHFGAYTPGDGFDVTGQISASYPISERWLFESYYKYTDVSDEIVANPIMDFANDLPSRQENTTEFGILISYVF